MTFRHAPIGELVERVKTWNPARESPDGDFKYVDLSSVDQNSKTIVGNQIIKGMDAPSRARQLVNAKDVLVATVRPNLNSVATVSIQFDGATASTGFCVLRPLADKLVNTFLFHWVKSPQFVNDMVRKATGASYPAVSDRIIFESLIPLPRLAEQRRIADILDRADALRAKRRAALALLDTLPQSIFLEMFGDPVRNPKQFPSAQLADAIELRGGFAFKSDDYVPVGIPLVRIGEVNRGGVSRETACFLPATNETTLARFIVRPGDMLMSLTGTTGKDDYANVIFLDDTFDRYFVNQRVALIEPKPDVLERHYLLHVFRNPRVKFRLTSKSRGIRQANISNCDVLELELPVPPIELQREFARRVETMEKLKAAHRASQAKLDELFASLQHRAFRGEL